MTNNHKGTQRLFQNPILERLTRTHIAVPISLFILYGLALVYWNIVSVGLRPFFTGILFLGGLMFFTLVEYAMHRFVFHMNTNTKLEESIQYKIHGVHHEYPKDKERLAMPPIVSIAIATALLFLFKFIIGDMVFAFLPGFLFGYAGYLFVHYMVHAYPPPNNGFKIFWIFHARHHYKSHDTAFGVTSPLWDYIFKTMP
jgi:sterol desaturase/sphingolipid hydroxylase (fatty acid hydroxylase superfamily)